MELFFKSNISCNMKRLAIILGVYYLLGTGYGKAQNNLQSAFAKSYTQEYTQNYKEAIATLESAYDAKSYEINLRLGWLYYLVKDFAKSASYYKKAIALKPSSIEARMGLVNPLYAAGNWDELLYNYLEILKIDPQNTTVNYRVALMYFNKKNNAKAEIYVNNVLRIYPFDYDSNILAARIMIANGKVSEAKQLLNTALLYSPNSKEAQELLAKVK